MPAASLDKSGVPVRNSFTSISTWNPIIFQKQLKKIDWNEKAIQVSYFLLQIW